MISVIFVLLTFCFSPAYVLRVCSRKRYVFTSTAVLQRVHLSTPELCVERCIENMAFCKAAVFMPLKDKSIGVCTLFSENSIQQPMALHPDASVEPVSTVHELLQSCPQFALPEITNRISSNHRRKLESKIGRSRASDEALRPDVFFRDGEQYNDERHRSAADRYATMTPLYHEEGPKYSDSREVHRPKSPFEAGAMCVPTLASLDSSPCPARQGDPCAPKPPCYPTTCMNADSQIVQSTWTEWTQCSQTCGRGTRTRHCSGVGCLGPAVESCSMMLACQEWTLWSSWSACSTSCGEGERKRTRECIGGRDCPGILHFRLWRHALLRLVLRGLNGDRGKVVASPVDRAKKADIENVSQTSYVLGRQTRIGFAIMAIVHNGLRGLRGQFAQEAVTLAKR
ncbi:unnamed protein product [Nippostrongylus brasiliensis]|uniref:Apple domain-containing protein n=1 Tax=Nippostrongylus brasiliensis TaxID=27835 RepID=A0A0N4XW83_NIPBR|nr:unnamed protein product [Nippostrongylus brasiliensis]